MTVGTGARLTPIEVGDYVSAIQMFQRAATPVQAGEACGRLGAHTIRRVVCSRGACVPLRARAEPRFAVRAHVRATHAEQLRSGGWLGDHVSAPRQP